MDPLTFPQHRHAAEAAGGLVILGALAWALMNDDQRRRIAALASSLAAVGRARTEQEAAIAYQEGVEAGLAGARRSMEAPN